MWRHGFPDGGGAAARLRAWTPAGWPLLARVAAAAFCLVAVGGGAITVATHVVARDYLTRQADQQLRSYAGQLTSRPFTLFPGFRRAPGASGLGTTGPALGVAVLSAGGQQLISAGPATPSAPRGGWLEISEPVSYRARHIPFVYGADDSSFSVTSKIRSGYSGTLVIGLNLAGTGQAVGDLTVLSLQMTGLAALLAAAAAAVITRTLLRPRTLTAGAEAAGAGVAARDPAGAKAAARDAAGRTAAAVAETCRRMRRPLSVLAGLAEYHRGNGGLADDEAERVMRQVADEAGRMAALVDELEAAARDDPRPGGLAAEEEKRWTAGDGHDRLAW